MLSRTDYRVPLFWVDWLADAGSLTGRLLQASNGDLKVKVVSQRLAVPTLSERCMLGLKEKRCAMIREVVLYGAGQPWVYARSILPLATLTGRLRKLRRLDSRPLGALLFSDPTMRREPVQFTSFHSNAGRPIWGRRSVFRLDNKPLLVAEFFLPTFKPLTP